MTFDFRDIKGEMMPVIVRNFKTNMTHEEKCFLFLWERYWKSRKESCDNFSICIKIVLHCAAISNVIIDKIMISDQNKNTLLQLLYELGVDYILKQKKHNDNKNEKYWCVIMKDWFSVIGTDRRYLLQSEHFILEQ